MSSNWLLFKVCIRYIKSLTYYIMGKDFGGAPEKQGDPKTPTNTMKKLQLRNPLKLRLFESPYHLTVKEQGGCRCRFFSIHGHSLRPRSIPVCHSLSQSNIVPPDPLYGKHVLYETWPPARSLQCQKMAFTDVGLQACTRWHGGAPHGATRAVRAGPAV